MMGLAYATLFMIAMTTVSALWNTIASVFAAHSRKHIKTNLKFGGIMTLLVALSNYLIANIFIDEIFDKMVLMNIPIASLSYGLLAGFYSKKTTLLSCLVSMGVGITGGLICYFTFNENDFIWYWAVYVIPLHFISGFLVALGTNIYNRHLA